MTPSHFAMAGLTESPLVESVPESALVAVEDLHDYPGNPRTHDARALDASVAVLGQYRPLLARRLADGSVQLLAGHGTRDALVRAGKPRVAVTVIEADDERAARIVAADNRIGDLGGYDEQLLAELLQGLPDLDGTGYEPENLDELLAGLDSGMFDGPAANPRGERVVAGRDGEDDDEPFKELDGEIKTRHTCPSCGYSWR